MNGQDMEIGRVTLPGRGLCNFNFRDVSFVLEPFSVQEIQACPAKPIRKDVDFQLYSGSDRVESHAFGNYYVEGNTYVYGNVTCEHTQGNPVPVHGVATVQAVATTPVAVQAICPATVRVLGSYVVTNGGAGSAWWSFDRNAQDTMANITQLVPGRQYVSAYVRADASVATSMTFKVAPAGGPSVASASVPYRVTCIAPPAHGTLPAGAFQRPQIPQVHP